MVVEYTSSFIVLGYWVDDCHFRYTVDCCNGGLWFWVGVTYISGVRGQWFSIKRPDAITLYSGSIGVLSFKKIKK